MKLHRYPPRPGTKCPEGTTLAGVDFARKVLGGMARNFPRPLASIPEQVDPLCLEQACAQSIRELYCEVAVFADHFDVPGDVLLDILGHWIVSDLMGWDRTPPHFFTLEKEPQDSDEGPVTPHLRGRCDAIERRGILLPATVRHKRP
jgi:hypothetical protein